ncbi:MAG: hypothetical protein QF551_06100 [Candidatus Marinimicrobia bacterium]|jgi:hypothetical protein|nr:hypothetical protein [Candidatus Neomarinimicrobiota bacterium]
MLSILKQKQFSKLILLMTWFSSLQLAGQVMICSDAVNLYSVERNAIVAGVADRYLSSRFDHEWRQSLSDGSPGLITSVAGDKLLRQERLKWYPEIRVRAALNGGDLRTEGATVDAAPIVTTAAHYRLPFLTRLGLVTWMRFEKHSVVGAESLSPFEYDFSRQKEAGRESFHNSDSNWVEYDIGDAGVHLIHPGGEITFAKSNPIWGTGYSGQLWLSDKAPSFPLLSLRHRFGDRWLFSFMHGSLNSTFRDSTYFELHPVKGGLPMIRKYSVAHRLDFFLRQNIRLGFGESVIYGGRSVEMSYMLPFLFYWSAQHDLSDSDNLQMFLDFEAIGKNRGRLYGSLFLDEWDFMNTFNQEKSHNWLAYQVGVTVLLPLFPSSVPLLRAEYTHLSPYVYVHRSKINTFEHHGYPLGFWSGPNSDSFFLGVEAAPSDKLWFQLYSVISRRGEVTEETVERQYNRERIDFLYRTYSGAAERKTVLGLRGDLLSSRPIRIRFDFSYQIWDQHLSLSSLQRQNRSKLDGIVEVSLGF